MTTGAPDMLGIRGRTAVVSASSRGVGRAVAIALSRAGVNVAVNYRSSEEAAKEVVSAALANGVKAIAVRADVTDPEDAAMLIRRAEGSLGGVDILVNCAHGRINRAAITDSGWPDHKAQIEGALRSALNLTGAASAGMRDRGWGRIVNIGNNMVSEPVKGYSAYTSAMASLLGFTRNLAVEAGPWGVTVNMVSTGFVVTETMPNTTQSVRDAIKAATPLGRLAVPDDIAGAVLFFASDMGGFVTGANLSVDGGKVMS
ncbi:MAG TPA: SDR family oxidoreductase [Nitrospirota bacterium]|jgi:3-oxoacyl-[acyl-carrier protein] reductase